MLLAAAWLAVGSAAAPAPVPNAAAIDTAIVACERWLLDPASWAGNMQAFGRDAGLQPQASVPDVALPPPAMRVALHHWRVPIGEGGILVTASDRLPVCHLAGGGPFDLNPPVVALLQSAAWNRRWKAAGSTRQGGMATRRFVNLRDPELTMTLSYAAAAGGRTDRVQMIATAQYNPGK